MQAAFVSATGLTLRAIYQLLCLRQQLLSSLSKGLALKKAIDRMHKCGEHCRIGAKRPHQPLYEASSFVYTVSNFMAQTRLVSTWLIGFTNENSSFTIHLVYTVSSMNKIWVGATVVLPSIQESIFLLFILSCCCCRPRLERKGSPTVLLRFQMEIDSTSCSDIRETKETVGNVGSLFYSKWKEK